MNVPSRSDVAVGVLAPLYVEQRTARPLAQAGWRVVRCGVGEARATAAAQALLATGARRLLVWGSAGALDADLAPGTLVIPERIVTPRGDSLALDAGWQDRLFVLLERGRHIRRGTLASVAHPVPSPAEKAALAAHSGAIAVDMEAAAVAAVAAAAGVPCAVLRAIVDSRELALPQAVRAAIGDRFLASEIALRSLLRPRDLPATVRLGRAFRIARRALTDAAHVLAAAAPTV